MKFSSHANLFIFMCSWVDFEQWPIMWHVMPRNTVPNICLQWIMILHIHYNFNILESDTLHVYQIWQLLQERNKITWGNSGWNGNNFNSHLTLVYVTTQEKMLHRMVKFASHFLRSYKGRIIRFSKKMGKWPRKDWEPLILNKGEIQFTTGSHQMYPGKQIMSYLLPLPMEVQMTHYFDQCSQSECNG